MIHDKPMQDVQGLGLVPMVVEQTSRGRAFF